MTTITYNELRQLRQHSAWRRSTVDEVINTVTHAAGLMLAIVGAVVMGDSLLGRGDAWRIAGCGVFIASLIAVYSASMLSHGCSTVRWKSFFRRLDQGFIYFLIVATYTPFGLAYLRTGGGWLILGALWTAAVVGFVSKVMLSHRVHSISIWTYVVLGLLPVITVPALKETVPVDSTLWMFGGGLCYLAGTLFLIFDAKVRHFHAVWHLLVIAGSICHFLGILESVARAG